jgi:hypothetical protein
MSLRSPTFDARQPNAQMSCEDGRNTACEAEGAERNWRDRRASGGRDTPLAVNSIRLLYGDVPHI